MSGPGSVTVWLERLKAGGGRDEVVDRLWKRYFDRLVRQAQHHLRGRRAAADGEDVALSAFDKFVRGVEAGKFPKLDDRHDLWAVLLRVTANKARNAVRDENRDKRGGGRAVRVIAEGESDLGGVPVPAADPDPADVAALADVADRLLPALNDELRRVAVWRLEGHSVEEIAGRLGRVVSTAERKLARVREIWAGMGYG